MVVSINHHNTCFHAYMICRHVRVNIINEYYEKYPENIILDLKAVNKLAGKINMLMEEGMVITEIDIFGKRIPLQLQCIKKELRAVTQFLKEEAILRQVK